MEHFVTKCGKMMQHHEPECHAEICVCVCVCAIVKVKVTAKTYMIKIQLFLLYFLTC